MAPWTKVKRFPPNIYKISKRKNRVIYDALRNRNWIKDIKSIRTMALSPPNIFVSSIFCEKWCNGYSLRLEHKMTSSGNLQQMKITQQSWLMTRNSLDLRSLIMKT